MAPSGTHSEWHPCGDRTFCHSSAALCRGIWASGWCQTGGRRTPPCSAWGSSQPSQPNQQPSHCQALGLVEGSVGHSVLYQQDWYSGCRETTLSRVGDANQCRGGMPSEQGTRAGGHMVRLWLRRAQRACDLSLCVAATQSEMLDQDLAPQHHRDGRDLSEVSSLPCLPSAFVSAVREP